MSTNRSEAAFLPDEIIWEVFTYLSQVSESQQAFWSCCLVSRQWYACAVPFLYAKPRLYGKNFDPFAATICPSVNLHIRKSPLAEYVRQLDMGRLVHQGSKSLTARILGRVKGGLELFVAPQASFAISCFAALSKCSKLWLLDLSLIVEVIPLDSLLRCLGHLPTLRVLYFPRLSDTTVEYSTTQWTWPQDLQELWITNGGIPDSFIRNVAGLPPTLNTLTIQRCSKVSFSALRRLLRALSVQLRVLRISELPQLLQSSLDDIPQLCPNLDQLSVPICNITQEFFDVKHGLRYLEITASESGAVEEYDVVPVDIYFALSDRLLPNLRGVCYPGNILAHSRDFDQEFDTLDDILLERLGLDESSPRQKRKSMTLREMAERDLIGAWRWYPVYEARHELRHH